MRDQKRRAALHQAIHGFEDHGFGLHVDRARRLVEDQERRVLQECARQRDPLALATGELNPALSDRRRIAARQARDEVVRARRLRRPHDVEVACSRAPVSDVLPDTGRKQHGLLEDDGELVPQVGEAVVAQVHAVEEDGAGRRVVEAGQETHEGRLPGSSRPHDRDARAGRHCERDVVQYRTVRIVGEEHVLEFHRASGAHEGSRVESLGDIGPLVQQREGPLGAREIRLETCRLPADRLQGLVQLGEVTHHQQQLPQRESAGADVAHADQQHGGRAERHGQPHVEAVAALEEREAEACRHSLA